MSATRIWKPAPHLVRGTLPPLVDPSTGFLFGGDVNTTRMNVIAAADPRLHVVVNTGRELGEITRVIPLGIEPPQNIVSGPNGSLAAFRTIVNLPGGMSAPRLIVESETVSGSVSAATLPPLPPAHLRGSSALSLSRALPATVMTQFPGLRYQRGANRYVSPWIIALADPRASKQYVWPAGADKAAAGCYACDRPQFLQNDSNAVEMYTNGRFISIRSDPTVFTASYSYLNNSGRLTARLSTVPADTVRPTNVLSAAQDPPAAVGALQSSVLLHSGEVVEQTTDLDAGGRAGWDVIFDRTYRSRTLGATMMGLGWESSILRHLRVLPNDNIEYRDGTGEEWLFRKSGSDYLSPAGLYLRLTQTQSGWSLVDQKQRITTFDALGRLSTESDVFYDGNGGGNIIRYVYDASGRLTLIVDPLGRVSTIAYDSDGALKTITDWRGRSIDYHFDSQGRLATVDLPRTKNSAYLEYDHTSDSTRPKLKYGYQQPSASDYNAKLELATNLRNIQEPGDSVPRLTLDYYESGNPRDMLQKETWGTTDHATASFAYSIDSQLRAAYESVVTDALTQRRTYSISALQPTNDFQDRVHTDRMVEHAIPIWAEAPFGSLPDGVIPSSAAMTNVDRTIAFGHENDGRLSTVTKSTTAGGISLTTYSYALAGTVGFVLQSRSITPSVLGMAGTVQNFAHSGAFLTSVESDGERVDAPEPHRNARTSQQSDGGVTAQMTYGNDGLIQESHTLPPIAPAAGTGEKAISEYFPADDTALHRRAMPQKLTAGDDLSTSITYPDADTELRDAPRGVQTRTEFDELRRPIHITVTGPGAIALEEWFAYDGRGRLIRHRRRQGEKQPEERYEYDVLGRLTRSSLYDGAIEVEATKNEYSLPDRINTTTLPAGGIITTTVDGLGRTLERLTDPLHLFATIIRERTRYDGDDNVVFTTDGRNATATRYDAAHRTVETLRSDSNRTAMKIDGWGRLRESKDLGTGALFRAGYTPGGKLQSVTTNTSSQDYAWDAAGRTRSVVSRRGANEAVTQSSSEFDSAGRLLEAKSGASNGTDITRLFSHNRYLYGGTDVPGTVIASEDDDASSSTWNLSHDALGQATTIQNVASSSFKYEHSFDESGNVKTSKTPSRPGTFAYKHDARGLTTDEVLPNTAAPNHYAFDPSGAIKQYLDPQGEETRVTNDGLGRPVLRTYADGSTEEIHYNGDQVEQIRDRQGRILNFSYNLKGQLEEIHSPGALLDQLTYDIAGRLIGWKSEGSKIEYDDFDPDDRPQTTRQIRYRPDGTELDRYTQHHTWNGTGQRTSWSMPGSPGSAGWTSTVFEEHDAMGNVSAIRRSAQGASVVLMTAEFRNAGRPKSRTVTLGAGPAQLVRRYEYDDAQSGVGRLTEVKVFSGSTLIAGSRIGFAGLLRETEQLLGIAGAERSTRWTYDDRGRLTGMAAAAAQTLPPQVIPRLTDADFQTELTRVSGALASAQFTPVAGHKIATITRAGQPESLRYQRTDGTDGGSQRTEDARFRYEFDERGRLRKITEKLAGQPRLKRVVYSYNAMDRVVGRQIETAPVTNGQQPQESDWAASAESTTFVWDPFSDQLIAMFEAGTGRPLRQFIHGGMGYDDPIEVFDGVKRYYPILDEAGTGSLQAVVDEQGQLVNRTIIADPYGEDAEALNGPAVDKITISGTSSDVKVSMHVTEPVDASTLGGVRLVPTATPVLSDPFTITWTLTSLPAQGNLSIEATTLRSTTFGPSVPVLFSGFTISVSAIPRDSTITPYNVTSLATLGTRATTDVSAALVMSPFKAHPFTDPFTGLDYVRARWLDRRTGTFLTPDPVGYRDSANLYAYCAGDPVNCDDPSGKAVYVVYRALDIQGGAAVYPAAGHVYLGFDSEGLPDLAHWRALVNHIGGQRGANPRLRRDPNPEAETFSFHPTSVLTQSGDNNLVSTTVTRGSYVGYNDTRADQIPFRRAVRELNAFGPTPLTKMHEKGAIVFRIAATQQQQEQLYVAAIASRDSINWGLNQSGSYKLGTNNCASWAQDMVLREGLKWPRAAMLCNGGAALGGPISGLAAAATAALDIVGYERYGLRLMKEDWMKQNSAPPDPLAQDWITKYRETMQKAGALPIQ